MVIIMKTKLGKRLMAMTMCVALVFAMAVPAFAAANDVVTSCKYADTSHPFAFFTAKSTSSKVINQYTTGRPVVGTPLTTWDWTGDYSQMFEQVVFTANGQIGYGWSVWGNQTLVINCKRSGSAPEVNLANAIGNYRADIEVFGPNNGGGKLWVGPRSVHSSNMYITVGSAMSGGNYLNWTPSGTTFYQYDVGLHTFY